MDENFKDFDDLEKDDLISLDEEEYVEHNDEFIDEILEPYKKEKKIVDINDNIEFSYKTLLEDGTIVDQKTIEDPMKVKVGSETLLKSFEEKLIGMFEGEKKTFIIENAYGKSNPKLIESIYQSSLPEQFHEVGHTYSFKGKDNKFHYAKVIEIKDGIVKLDFNNPLTDSDLKFEVKILKIHKIEK